MTSHLGFRYGNQIHFSQTGISYVHYIFSEFPRSLRKSPSLCSVLHSHKLATHWDIEDLVCMYVYKTRDAMFGILTLANVSYHYSSVLPCQPWPLTENLTYLRRDAAEFPLRSNREIPTTNKNAMSWSISRDCKAIAHSFMTPFTQRLPWRCFQTRVNVHKFVMEMWDGCVWESGVISWCVQRSTRWI